MTDEQLNRIFDELSVITKTTVSIDLKIHKRYTEEDLINARREIEALIGEADEWYCELTSKPSDVADNDNIYKEISGYFKELKNPQLSKEDELEYYANLFECYNSLKYSFCTAKNETKNLIYAHRKDKNTRVILLCKNVRIMEDLINKICSNNIDKSIIGGEQHFDSIKCGFEWLFCHKDIGNNNKTKQIDIRDSNRYLDYIKYQIMVASKYAEASPKATTDIDQFFEKIKFVFDNEKYDTRTQRINRFKRNVEQLIEIFFRVYELLIKYRDALFREEEIRKSLAAPLSQVGDAFDSISINVVNLSSVAVRVLLDRFVSFVKISDLNFGNSTLGRAWFNYSELSKSNYAGSNFKYARIENAKMKECDISTCNLILADGGRTDFSYSNFNYSNLTGINFVNAIVNYCEFQNAIFIDANIDNYKRVIQDTIGNLYNGADKGIANRRAMKLVEAWIVDDPDAIPIDNAIQSIITEYQKLHLESLTISNSLQKSWTILQYIPQGEDLLHGIAFKMRKVVKWCMRQRISAELLYYAKTIFSRQRKRQKDERVEEHGNVLFDTANLTNVSAKNSQLSGDDLSHIVMPRSSFENADLSGVTMHYTKAKASSFIYCNMNQAEYFESDFQLANFSSAVLNNTIFINCNLNRTNWNKTIIVGSVFADFSFFVEENICAGMDKPLCLQINQNIKFCKDNGEIIGDLPNYDMLLLKEQNCPEEFRKFWQTECSINDATFSDSLADRAVFLNIMADRSIFNRASLKNTFWANCRTYLSDFVETDFRYSSILFCCMGQSNFKKANLTSTSIRYVDFSGCNLSGALFNISNINHALFENVNLQSLNFSGSEIANSAFENCKFNEVIIAGATFNNCIFFNVDFSNLYGLHSSVFANCYFEKCSFDDDDIDDGICDLVKRFGNR